MARSECCHFNSGPSAGRCIGISAQKMQLETGTQTFGQQLTDGPVSNSLYSLGRRSEPTSSAVASRTAAASAASCAAAAASRAAASSSLNPSSFFLNPELSMWNRRCRSSAAVLNSDSSSTAAAAEAWAVSASRLAASSSLHALNL